MATLKIEENWFWIDIWFFNLKSCVKIYQAMLKSLFDSKQIDMFLQKSILKFCYLIFFPLHFIGKYFVSLVTTIEVFGKCFKKAPLFSKFSKSGGGGNAPSNEGPGKRYQVYDLQRPCSMLILGWSSSLEVFRRYMFF